MPQLLGTKIERGDFPKFTWNADLIEFDGPLVSLYRTENDADALWVWLDRSRGGERWCALAVERENLGQYLLQKRTLKSLFELQEQVIVFNLGSKGRKTLAQWVSVEDLPEHYVPTDKSMLTDDVATDMARELVVEKTSKYKAALDKDLYLEDVQLIPKILSQLYSFHYGLAYAGRAAVTAKLQDIMKSWNGGINAVNIFTGLQSVMPSVHRPRVSQIQYASPGFIEMDLLPSLLGDIKASCERIALPHVFKDTEALYSEVYKYFRKERLSGFDKDGGVKLQTITPRQTRDLEEFISDFFDAMEWGVQSQNFAALPNSPLAKIRVLLAYYRRLRQIRPLLAQGKLSFP